MGFSIQKGLSAAIAAMAISWRKKLGGDGHGADLEVCEEFAVVGVGALEAEDVEGVRACLFGGVGGCHEAGRDLKVGEVCHDVGVGA